MAANRSQYNDMPVDARSTNGITVRHWFGKLHTNRATHLARFFLDEIIGNVDASGVKGYLGVCNVGSANYNMHAVARRGCIAMGTAGGTGLAFQDGGLHTLPFANLPTFPSETVGSIQVQVQFIAAYYVASSSFGVQFYLAGAWVTRATFYGLNENNTVTKTHLEYQITDRQAGDVIPVRAFHINDEGTYYSASANMTLKPAQLTLKYNITWASWANDGTATLTVWVGVLPLDIGTKFYLTEDMVFPPYAEPGYYISGSRWYEVRLASGVMQVVASDYCAVGYYPAGDPGNTVVLPTPPTTTGYIFEFESEYGPLHDTCTINHSGTDVIYYNASDGKYYENWAEGSGFSGLFTGYIMVSSDCSARHFLAGVYQGMYYP